jgi:hypothetical protein
MKIRDIILLEMSYADAINILQRHDSSFPTRDISKETITTYRRRFAKKYHPDLGHTGEELKIINAALDVVSRSWGEPEIRYYYSKREEPRQERTSYYPTGKAIWAQAGWAGGVQIDDTIYRSDFKDTNYVKKTAWEKSGSNPNPTKRDEFTFWNFDGNYPRGAWSVFAKMSLSFLREVASWMVIWDYYNTSKAVLVTGSQIGDKKVLVIVGDKKYFYLSHHSFNKNPFNDKDFVEELKRKLSK